MSDILDDLTALLCHKVLYSEQLNLPSGHEQVRIPIIISRAFKEITRLRADNEQLRMTPAEVEAVEDSARDCRQRADSIMGLPTDIRLAASIQATTLHALAERHKIKEQ